MNREDALHLARWSEFLVANGLSAVTVKHYRYAMLRLVSEANVGILGIGEPQIVAFLASLGKRAHSRQLYLRAFKSFYGWAFERNYIETNPAAHLHPKAPIDPPPDAYSPEEIASLVRAAGARDPRYAHAILACYALGLRRSELCGILPEDIDWQGRRVYIRCAKGDRPRWVEANEMALEALRGLASQSPRALKELGAGHPVPWLPGDSNGRRVPVNPRGATPDGNSSGPIEPEAGRSVLEPPPLLGNNSTVVAFHPQWFTMIVHRAAEEAGLPPNRRRAHMLRASFVTELLGQGVPVSVASRLVGHANMATTHRYAAVRPEDRRRAVDVLPMPGGGA